MKDYKKAGRSPDDLDKLINDISGLTRLREITESLCSQPNFNSYRCPYFLSLFQRPQEDGKKVIML